MMKKIMCYRTLAAIFALLLQFAQYAWANPPILLANVLGEDADVTQYLVSEKYDGVRAIWDGKVMRFRSGNIINMPEWFRAKLPVTPLDGELWMGRQQFESLVSATRKTIPIDAEWQKIIYMVFEEPEGEGTFNERVARLKKTIDAANFAQLKLVDQFRVPDRLTLKRKLNEIVKAGGEGLKVSLSVPLVARDTAIE